MPDAYGVGARLVRMARLCAAMTVAAIIGELSLSAGPAAADADRGHPRLLLFSGIDLWRGGNFSHGGAFWSPRGLDRDGLLIKATLSGGTYHYRSGALANTRVFGRALGVQILPGWRFSRGRLEVKTFAGLDLRDHRLFPDDPSAGLRGRRTGVQIAAEVWYQPDDNTMLAADGAISTIDAVRHARIAYGWKLFERFHAGPEIAGFSAGSYSQFRIGLHITALRTGTWEWSGAIGFAGDSDGVSGAYGRLGVLTRK
jgi:hypothetical protein